MKNPIAHAIHSPLRRGGVSREAARGWGFQYPMLFTPLSGGVSREAARGWGFNLQLMNKILVTGATGFIGSFIVEEALRRDMEVWAAVRPTSSRRYLQDERIHFIELDLSSEERLIEQMRGHEFQYVVHAAGATKCINRDDFFRTNTLGTQNLVEALL